MRYIALLRGINVGGNTMIRMEELRQCFDSLGLKNVTTYINSGNVGFDSRQRAERSLINLLEDAIEKRFGWRVSVMLRKQSEIHRIIAANPYQGAFSDPREMHVLFLKEELAPEKRSELAETAPPTENFTTKGREIYCHVPRGVADSYLGRGQFEKKLKVAVTARNWRTVQRLATL